MVLVAVPHDLAALAIMPGLPRAVKVEVVMLLSFTVLAGTPG